MAIINATLIHKEDRLILLKSIKRIFTMSLPYSIVFLLSSLGSVFVPSKALMLSCHREEKFVKVSQGMYKRFFKLSKHFSSERNIKCSVLRRQC